jgi:hypothetical protein
VPAVIQPRVPVGRYWTVYEPGFGPGTDQVRLTLVSGSEPSLGVTPLTRSGVPATAADGAVVLAWSSDEAGPEPAEFTAKT